ncbi:MAG: class II aldolase/adducin family protein [Planctomycetota bacterium]|nr:class II aldolase/adducin family protein [Planctomycetota bacterium]
MNHSRNLLHPRDEIMHMMERIYRYRMTTTSGGNLSIRDQDGGIWITPARVDKGSLRREDIVCVRPDGSVDGRHPPSSEYPFHQAIYAARPDLRGIVHAHSVALVAFSISDRVPDTRLFHQTREVCGEAGLARYALPGSQALAANIVATFAQGFHCVLLENHGVVVGGESLQNAFQRFETLEFTAKTIIKAGVLGEVRYLTDDQLTLAQRVTSPLPQFRPAPPSSAEKELRRQLCTFLRRGYRNRLIISTEGSFSARVDADSFVITSHELDRHTVDLEDIVLVRDGACEAGQTPSHAARLHQAIYTQHPEVGAIVNAYTVNATAFSVTAAPLASRTIPESYLLLRDVQRVPFGLQFSAPEQLARRVSMEQPVAILENDGVLVCGTNTLDAFDRLEVLESTAETLINGRLLGNTTPMSDAVIAELTAAFL